MIKHLVVRFSDSMLDGIDTISEHQLVIDNKGAVLFGKIGRALAERKIELINSQIDRGQSTYLFLVQKTKNEYQWWQAKLEGAYKTLRREESDLVPLYYVNNKLNKQISTWFKASSIVAPSMETIRNCFVASSHRPINETINTSMASIFLVYFGKDSKPIKRSPYKVNYEQAILDLFEEDEYPDY